MTDAEIEEAVKAKLKEEGYATKESSSTPVVRHARPPAPLIEPTVSGHDSADTSSSNQSELPSNTSSSTHDAIDRAEREIAAQKKDQEDKDKNQFLTPQQKTVAAIGAALGLGARYKGLEAGADFLKPSEKFFQVKPTEEDVKKSASINEELTARQKALANINAEIQRITNDPTASAINMTPEQIHRILQGGEGSTLGTTGSQRSGGFNEEQQRLSRTLAETEKNVKRVNPNLPDPIVAGGQMVPLPGSNIRVPTTVATSIAQEQANAQAEQRLKNLQLIRQSEENKLGITQKQADQESNRAKSRGYRAGVAKGAAGVVGGADTALSAFDIYKKYAGGKPIDWQDISRFIGGLGMTFGGPKLGTAGALAQIPYFAKHQDEIARGMTMGDVVDPRVALFLTGQELFEPAIPGVQTDTQRYPPPKSGLP